MSLIDEFIREEINEYSMNVLQEAVEMWKVSPMVCKNEFMFNRFKIIFNFNHRTVVVQDDLDTSKKGEVTVGIEEFLDRIHSRKNK